jgi:hypothetical protein
LPDWQRAFDDPIPPPNARKLIFLHDAPTYSKRLAEAVQALKFQGMRASI